MANLLINESSVYLLQHAHNPVNWYPWGTTAFTIAKQENKPVLVSIGYAACHWCHVMERESFENEEVAAYMNTHFINIKVDREEHPDVDHLYMDALIAMQQSGGWPLNMFVTPEGKPFYGGTYFPPKKIYQRASWLETLTAIQAAWSTNKTAIDLQATQLVQHLQQISIVERPLYQFFDAEFSAVVINNLERQADKMLGGFTSAPKFPSFGCIQLLLDTGFFNKNDALLEEGVFHLKQILKGGIYDQIAGGIARYATDDKWLVPHFEKMLYDNALLISTISKAYQLKPAPYLKDKLVETIQFVMHDLKCRDGYASAIDADSEGEEGKYYIWQFEEINALLGDMHPAILEFWDISPEGNWEGSIILNETLDDQAILSKHNLEFTTWNAIKQEAKKRLCKERSQRIAPRLDSKIITSLNAMLTVAFIDAYKALQQDEYLNLAKEIIDNLQASYRLNLQLMHIYGADSKSILAKLDDYAWTIKALLAISPFMQEEGYLLMAVELMKKVNADFSDEQNRFYYFSDKNQTDVLVRKIETYDGATPSSNAIMVEQLIVLGNLLGNLEWIERAEHMALSMQAMAMKYPSSYSNWCINTQYIMNEWKINILVGQKSFAMIKKMLFIFMPNLYSIADVSIAADLRAKVKMDEEAALYALICTKGICNLPTKSIFKIFE